MPHASRFRRHRAEYEQKARELLAIVGLDGFADHYPWQLSGGMQQRASLCRSLIHEPELLLLDEPFGALDAFTREELWVVLQTLWQRHKFTVILVTHDLTEAVFLADTVHVSSKRPGRIPQYSTNRLFTYAFEPSGKALHTIAGILSTTSRSSASCVLITASA